MNNQDKINLIHSVVAPHFNFDLSIYGDMFSPIPKIEELNDLFFKREGKLNKYKKLSEFELENLISNINDLNIGDASFIKMNGVGQFICVRLKNDCHEMEI